MYRFGSERIANDASMPPFASEPRAAVTATVSARRPRIALVVPALIHGGGLRTVTRFLYDLIADQSVYEVDVISLALSFRDAESLRLFQPGTWVRGPVIVSGDWEGTPYRHVGAVLPEWETRRYMPRRVLTRLLTEYDLIQVIGGTPAWAVPALACGKPVCLSVATLAEVERQSVMRNGAWPRRFWRRRMTSAVGRLDQVALKSVDAVFVINRWMEEHARRLTEPSRVVFAPPGVDTQFFHVGEYRPDGHLLSVARFSDPRKNVRLLFHAYAELSRSMKTVPDLVLAGLTEPTAADWAYAQSLGVAKKIQVKKGVSRDCLRELYRNASAFILPSDEEGLGIVILEAMASGTPVVATRCGGPETIIVDQQNGYLTPVGDAHALASAISRLLTNPEGHVTMRALARQNVEQQFSIASTGRRFLAKYEELLAPGRPGVPVSP